MDSPNSNNRLKSSVRRESYDALLAKNLTAARLVVGMTQHELAAASDVSRATIAQLETGCSDPRLSTLVDLATALHIPPILLLLGLAEVKALTRLHQDASTESLQVPPQHLERMLSFVETGMLKDRLRAARIGASVARTLSNPSPSIPIIAGILSAILPGPGTTLGAALGQLLEDPLKPVTQTRIAFR